MSSRVLERPRSTVSHEPWDWPDVVGQDHCQLGGRDPLAAQGWGDYLVMAGIKRNPSRCVLYLGQSHPSVPAVNLQNDS